MCQMKCIPMSKYSNISCYEWLETKTCFIKFAF